MDCSFPDCGKRVLARGWCSGHYTQWRAGRPLHPIHSKLPPGVRAPCAEVGCDAPAREYARCVKHAAAYARSRGLKPYNKDAARASVLRRQFGITLEQYNEMRAAQGGVCAICGEACVSGRALAVDHDHASGVIRGLLCARCNTAIGLLRECPSLFDAAAQYLLKFKH